MATKRYQLAGIMGNKVYVGSGDMPEGFNVQIDPEGDCLEAVGAIITVPVNKWIANDDGTYTNTIDVEGVSDTTVYDISLYGDATDEQATAFSELITSVATTKGQIVITASESVTVELQLLLSGKINLADQEVVYVKDLKASRMSYDNTSSGLAATDVQGALDEVSGDVGELSSKLTDESEVTFTPNSDIMNGGNVNGDRFGNMCEITFGYQIKSGTYSSDTILGTCNVHPDHTVRFTVHTTNGSVSLYINKNGQVKFNSSSITFDSITYLLGQVFFVISE